MIKKIRVVSLTLFFMASMAFAQSTPTVMNYQGRLTDNSVNQVAIDTTVNITFTIHDHVTNVSPQWTETWTGVNVNNGIFSVLLGSNGTPIPASVFSASADLWLELTIDTETLSPRQRLGSVGFAFEDEAGNEYNTDLTLNGTSLEVTDGGGMLSTSLASLQDGTGTDDQVLSLVGNTLSVEDGNSVDLSGVGAGADNLGNHTATTNLNMNNREIDNINYLDIRPGNDYGLRFWSSNSYAISMGNSAEYMYGPVADYSIKMSMANDADRGWTWGVDGLSPIAALSVSGDYQLAGSFTVSAANASGGGLFLSDDGGLFDRNDGYGSLTFSNGVDFEDAQDNTDHLTLTFNDSYPELWGYRNGLATLVEFRTGMYNNGGTFYSEDQMYARGGIANDSGILLLNDNVNISSLAGTGNRMVVADPAGDLSTQTVPSGADNLGNHTATTTLAMGNNSITGVRDIVTSNYGTGLVGLYSSVRYQNVFSMGTAYRLAQDGTATGNHYGIAWTHSNVGGESIPGLGHQALFMTNADTRSAVGDGFWTKYNITANAFYDQNDASFFVNPAGNSNLNSLNLTGTVQANGGFNTPNSVSLRYSSTGQYGGSTGTNFGQSGVTLESGASESGGFHADGDQANIWSPGDGDRLLRVLDEDLMGSGEAAAEKWYINGSGTAFTVSDQRLKVNIRPLQNEKSNRSSLEKVLAMKGYKYGWKQTPEEVEKTLTGEHEPHTSIGFLAQELELLVPEAVNTNEAGIKSVAYDLVIPVLVEAIKEQQAMITAKTSVSAPSEANAALSKKIAVQEAELEKLRTEMEELKALVKALTN